MKLECCICNDKLGDGGRPVSSTNCGHLFHKECISAWLTKSVNGSCPQCRAYVREEHLRNIYFSNMLDRNSDIFNSSIVANLRDVQEDLCIMQTNLEHQIQHLKVDNEVLKDRADELAAENFTLTLSETKLQSDIVLLKTKNRLLVKKNDVLETAKASKKAQIDELLHQIKDLKNENQELKAKNSRLPRTRSKFGSTDNNTPKKLNLRQRKPPSVEVLDLDMD
ncbi:E3 ubiquitin-protein ligase TRAIP-like [Sitodiplosis mosellana]|uniref:E3 ubiquitin-protein ligase TRAIP-like n=1 Tax=Sitodiplosis mosellana TaxID=263140 RepID=UPI00244417A5|nr:E3 ubiquitin-protein ligase TRAIP-like [Sitodiplosis mosellana]